MKNPLEYRLALLFSPGIGPIHFYKLRQQFPDLAEIFSAKPALLRQWHLPEESIAGIVSPNWSLVDKHLSWASQAGNHLISYDSLAYPSQLKAIYAPPPFLFVRGDVSALTLPHIAMVGTRHPSHRAKEDAFYFAAELARRGYGVCSGLALGIDAESHRGALSLHGKTVAVMGVGLDQIYPRQHRTLAEEILTQKGCWVSEFPLETSIRPENFPRRNRIISGLSRGVFVVEAAMRSGSLITARYALEQGREVYAMPGSIHNPLAKGCHYLLKQGAKLVENVEDLLEELKTEALPLVENSLTNPDLAREPLLEWIEFTPVAFDDIVQRSGLEPRLLLQQLAVLELKGVIRQQGGRYVACS